MENKEANINIKSEEIQEILGKIPSWITRFGSLFILLALFSIIIVSAVVEYPDVIEGPVVISALNPPIPLYASQNGNIERLLVENNEAVTEGQLLGVFQNSANEDDLFLIENLLDSLIHYPDLAKKIEFPNDVELGAIQGSYSDFLTSLEDYIFYGNQNVSYSSIAYLQSQINELDKMTEGIRLQQKNCNAELQLLNKNYFTDLDLMKKGVISERVVDQSLAIFNQKKSECENLNISISNNQLKIQELKMQMFGQSSGDKQNVQTKIVSFRENATILSNEINLWKKQFLLVAPVAGFVSLNEVWSDNQYVEEKDEILSIVQNKNDVKVTAHVASKDMGKLKVEQNANIHLEAYNYLEHGILQGQVSNISAVPRNNLYQVDITLSNGLVTNYGEEIPFNQGMLGTVEIVSDKRTFLSRILDKFRYLFSKKY